MTANQTKIFGPHSCCGHQPSPTPLDTFPLGHVRTRNVDCKHCCQVIGSTTVYFFCFPSSNHLYVVQRIATELRLIITPYSLVFVVFGPPCCTHYPTARRLCAVATQQFYLPLCSQPQSQLQQQARSFSIMASAAPVASASTPAGSVTASPTGASIAAEAADICGRGLYIGGTWVQPVRGGTVPVVDPATEEVLCQCPAGNVKERVDRPLRPWAHTAGHPHLLGFVLRARFTGGCGQGCCCC